MKILTEYDPPPIPGRGFDWYAVTSEYEPGHPIGYGATELEARAHLQDQLDDELPPEFGDPKSAYANAVGISLTKEL